VTEQEERQQSIWKREEDLNSEFHIEKQISLIMVLGKLFPRISGV
jgi:hypothetical protein